MDAEQLTGEPRRKPPPIDFDVKAIAVNYIRLVHSTTSLGNASIFKSGETDKIYELQLKLAAELSRRVHRNACGDTR